MAVCGLYASTGGEISTPQLFGYYQPILDRMPFGAMPDNFSADPQEIAASQLEAKAKAEQEALAKKIKMSVVNVTPAGATTIGFTDLAVNPPVNHYVKVGESSAGWLVVSADYSLGLAVIEKDGVTVELSLPESSPAAAAPGAETTENAKPPLQKSRHGLLSRRASKGIHKRSFPKVTQTRMPVPGLQNSTSLDSAAATEDAPGQAKPAPVSYNDRLRERDAQKTRDQLANAAKMREQFEKLARETATKEIQRREEEALLAAQEEAELQQWLTEQQQTVELPLTQEPAALQEGNLE